MESKGDRSAQPHTIVNIALPGGWQATWCLSCNPPTIGATATSA